MDLLSILNLEDAPAYSEQAGTTGTEVKSTKGHPQTAVNHSRLDFETEFTDWVPQLTPTGSPGSNEGPRSLHASSGSFSALRNGLYHQTDIYATSGRLAGRTQLSVSTYGLDRQHGLHKTSHQPYHVRNTQTSATSRASGLSTPPSTPPTSSPVTPYARSRHSLYGHGTVSSQNRGHRREIASPNIQSSGPRRLPGVSEIRTLAHLTEKTDVGLRGSLTCVAVNQSNYQPEGTAPAISESKGSYGESRNSNTVFTSINQRPPIISDQDNELDISSRRNKTDCYVPDCKLDSPDRRVISHFFGRNKKETRAIPEDCWISYCRQHYQRSRYQMKIHEFGELQMSLVRRTVENLESCGIVLYWTITIRKRMMDEIAKEDSLTAAGKAHLIERPCQERVLIPYCGENKSFRDVYRLIDDVKNFACRNDCEALEFEIVPQFRPGYVEKRISQRRASTKMPVRSKRASSSSASVKTSVKTNTSASISNAIKGKS